MNKEQLSVNTESVIYPAQENITGMTQAAWALSIIIFWPVSVFSEEEIKKTKKHIRQFLINAADPYKAYLEYCQRILLMRQYLLDNDGATIPELPSHWLQARHGFPISAIWFKTLQRVRTALPLYKHDMKALAEAVLEMTEDPTASNFNYWISWFKARNANDELMMFSMHCAFNQFKAV